MTDSNAATLLAELLRRVRISDSMQYCYMPSGDWETDATPAPYKPKDSISFHILAVGSCWLEFQGRRTDLHAGDIAAFPFGSPHRIGAGIGGPEIDPGAALPSAPWIETPILRYGDDVRQVRLLCGYVRCDAMNFAPFREALPEFIHISTSGGGDWLAAVVAQLVAEVDAPRGGGSAVLERLTEIALLEVLRRQMLGRPEAARGWLAAIHDPVLGRCLRLLHDDPVRPWTLDDLVHRAGASRSVIASRFTEMLGRAPIAYLRDWRLFRAREQLLQTGQPIARIAEEAGYASEAAFNRAFTRACGMPPATWRSRSGRPVTGA